MNRKLEQFFAQRKDSLNSIWPMNFLTKQNFYRNILFCHLPCRLSVNLSVCLPPLISTNIPLYTCICTTIYKHNILMKLLWNHYILQSSSFCAFCADSLVWIYDHHKLPMLFWNIHACFTWSHPSYLINHRLATWPLISV